MYKNEQRLPLQKAVLLIFFSTLLISGSGTLGWLYYLHIQQLRVSDDRFTILSIIESCQGETLPSGYLPNLMQLTLKNPVNLYRFSKAEAEKRLLADPLIRKAEVKKVYPNKIWIDYQLRKPIALLDDYTNTAIDVQGFLFPYAPIYEMNEIPRFYLGIDPIPKVWGTRLNHPHFSLACKILESARQIHPIEKIEKIDVADASSLSCGKQQIILVLKDESNQKILRLPIENYEYALENYRILSQREKLKDPTTIDLRIPQLAFLKEE